MGLVQIGVVFMVCGLMMLVVQLGGLAPSAPLGRSASRLPIFAWSGRRAHEPPGARAAKKGKVAFGKQEAR